jgi:hypothetical protein
MEQHPVPQNVTTFQFRLIGDMTIKQFGYLAGGAILAYISYRLPLPFFFTWPLTMIFGLGGVGFAFVPIEERPMDVWVLSFIKSVYSPTQFVWQQQIFPPVPPVLQPPIQQSPAQQQPPLAPRTTTDVLQGMFTPTRLSDPSASRVVSIQQHTGIWDIIMHFFSPTQQNIPSAAPVSPVRFSTPSITGKHIDISSPPSVVPNTNQEKIIEEAKEKEVVLEEKLSTLKKDLEDKSMTEARILELQKQLTELLTQKDKMQQEIEAFRKAAPQQTNPNTVIPAAPSSASSVATPQTPKTQNVKIITPESAVKAGLPRLTTFPNVVTGIIKDSDNNLLPGVLVTVKDKDGMPLRALKTNRLGQFAASTPLSNGVYFVEIEDPRTRYIFDRVQITLNGSIVPAIEVVARSQKQINRAMLEKELFGKPT